jgi:TP901 family phage tail tape measure protein
MTVALQFTAIDMVSGIANRVRNSIMSLGSASKEVKKDFDEMSSHVTSGLKAIAVSSYMISKIRPGVQAAGDLQEAMLGVKMNLAGSAKNARQLKDMLDQVESTAIAVSANAPFSAEDVVRIENSLLKAGMDIKDVVGGSGAAFAATALASLSGEMPEVVGDAMANIGTMFKFKGADYKTFADWLTRVDDAAATNLPALIQGLRMAGSSAAALGVSANDSITALGALAPLGERAGSSFNNFMLSFAVRRKEMKAMGMDFFAGGKFVGMDKAVEMLKNKFGAIKDDGERLGILTKLFGEEGGRAANTFINAEKSFREIKNSAKDALGVTEKLNIWGEGFNANLKKLAGTAKATLATLFDPLLTPLTWMLKALNTITGKIGKIAKEVPGVALGVSGSLAAIAIATAAYGAYRLGRGASAGRSVLKGMGGLKGMLGNLGGKAAGIAEGKAVEAATGVTPVFVTNWPAGGLGATPGVPVPGAAKLAALAPVIGTVGAIISAAVATTTAVSSLVDAMRGGSGDNWINQAVTGGEQLEVFKGKWGDMLYDLLHKQKQEKQKPAEVGGKIQIEIKQDGRAVVNKIQSKNPAVQLDASTGLLMLGSR